MLFLPVNIQILKVLHIINSLATGGAEKLIIETLPLLNKTEDVEVELALLNAFDYQFYIEFKQVHPDIKVIEISKGSVYNPFLIFKIIPLLKNYKILHVHLFPALYWVAFAKLFSFSSIPLFFTEHSTNNRRLRNPIARLVDRFIYLFYNKVICISTEVKNQIKNLLKIPEKKLKVITNGINLNAIKLEKALDRGISIAQHKDILSVLIKNANANIASGNYTTTINAAWQRKSLETSYRYLFVLKDILEEQKKSNAAAIANLISITTISFLIY